MIASGPYPFILYEKRNASVLSAGRDICQPYSAGLSSAEFIKEKVVYAPVL